MKVVRKIFLIYIIMLSIVLLFKFNLYIPYIMDKVNSIKASREQGAWNINLVPFRTISSQVDMLKNIPAIAIKNLIGNIAIFIPFGFLLPMGYKAVRKYSRTLLLGFVYVLIIESIQFVCMLGSFDIDDIILNCLGISCGYVFYHFIILPMIHNQRKCRF